LKNKELFYLAKKITKSNNKFINFANLVALISVVVGCLALLLSLSILNGFDKKLRETAIKFTSDICVITINGSEIEDIDEVRNQILENKNIRDALPVLQTEGIVSTPKYTEGISLQSINPQNDIKNFAQNIIEGEFSFSTVDANEIIIGKALAKKLNAKLGDKLMIYALKSKDNISFSAASFSQFTIKAIYSSGMEQYDNSVVFFPYLALANFLEKPPTVATYFEIYLHDIDNVYQVAYQIDDHLGFPFFSSTFYEINSSIFKWIELQKEPIPIVLAIISLVASFNIITMLIITVVEKSHSIGILRTIGLSNKKIILIFVSIALRTAFIGSIIGLALSSIFVFLQTKFSLITLDSKIYFIDRLPIDMELIYVIRVLGLALIFSLLASLIPSIIAVRVSPVKAIRFK
jgi:lipoprotein-releasing system permease protein